MRTAEHMEHRNLERKWRPSFALGPHLTEGRSNDERTEIFFSLSCLFSVAAMHLIFLSADELVVAGNLSPRFLKVFRWYWCVFCPAGIARELPNLERLGAARLKCPRFLKYKKEEKTRGAKVFAPLLLFLSIPKEKPF